MGKPRLLVAFIAFALALSASTATASRSIQVRGLPIGGGASAASLLTFGATEGARALQLICDVTLLRTVASSIPKIAGTLFGKVTGVAIDRGINGEHCRSGEFIRRLLEIIPLRERAVGGVLQFGTHTELGNGVLLYVVTGGRPELWKLIYDSFQGTLPRIEGINFHIQGVQFKLRVQEALFGILIECLYEGSVFGLIRIQRETGAVTGATVVEERTRLARVLGAGSCAERSTFRGTFAIRPALTIALV